MRVRHQGQGGAGLVRQPASMRGFSLIEMMIVIAIALTISGFAIFTSAGAVRDARVNGAYDTAFMQLRLARQRAIEERKRYIVTFGTPAVAGGVTPFGAPNAKSTQVYVWGQGTPATQVSTIDLPSDVSFQAISGVPNSAATVPDGLGSGIAAIDFDQGVGAGAGNLVMFMPDGSAHDLAGNYNSGILYLARNSDLYSSRALTVFGTSGRIRGWRLTQTGGVATWKQQ